MTRCQYKYVAGDGPVLSGKYQIGDQCTRKSVGKENHGLCFGHFKKWNKINDPAANKKLTAKQKETMLRHNKKREQKNKEIMSEEAEAMSKEALEVLHVMKADKEFDLAEEYVYCKALNLRPDQEKFVEKFVFALWLDTAAKLRIPKTFDEVCEILNVSIYTLNLWKRSPEIARMINEHVEGIVRGSLKWVISKVLLGVALGDQKSRDSMLKYIERIEEKTESKNKFPDLPKHLVKEAADAKGKLDNVANQVLKAAAYDSLTTGNVKPNDTVQ